MTIRRSKADTDAASGTATAEASTTSSAPLHIYSPRLAAVVHALPWTIGAFIMIAVGLGTDIMFLTGLTAALIASVLIRLLEGQVPGTLEAIGSRRLLAVARPSKSRDNSYDAYVREFERAFRMRWSLALACCSR